MSNQSDAVSTEKEFEAYHLVFKSSLLDTPFFDLEDFFPEQDKFREQQNPREPSSAQSTVEDLMSSPAHTSSKELFVSYVQEEREEASAIRAKFERIIDQDVFSNGLDQYPIDIKSLQNCEVERQSVSDTLFSDTLEIPSPQKPSDFQFTSPFDRERSLSEKDLKSPKNYQSRFKNTYSLAEGHARRLIKDWLSLDRFQLKQLTDKIIKNDTSIMQENNQIAADLNAFNTIDQEYNALKTKIKLAKKATPYSDLELKDLLAQQNSLRVQKKKQQKQLLQALSHKRFELVSLLSSLVNSNSNSFITKSELLQYVKKSPKTRALTCMKSLLKENIKCGLIVLRIAIELLSPTLSTSEFSKSSYTFIFWLIKTPMENKTKELFRNEASRERIRGVLVEIYLDLKEAAITELSVEDMQRLELFFESYESTVISRTNDFDKDFVYSPFCEEGKILKKIKSSQ